MSISDTISRNDIRILRELATWQAQEAQSPRNREKIQAWFAHDAGSERRRPMILVEIRNWEGNHGPIRERALQCEDTWARRLENRFRNLRHHVEVYQDDHVVPSYIPQHCIIQRTGFGLAGGQHREAGADRYAFNYSEAPLKTLDAADLARLRPSRTIVDHEAMARDRERLETIFRDILPVEIHDAPWQFHIPLTSTALNLVGLEGFMLLMYDNPEGLHRLMTFLRDQQMSHLDTLEAENVWTLNNGPDYVGAGSIGFTKDLPAADFDGRVRTIDRWGGFESQESVSISPDQYGEFVFQYMQPLLARFGKVYYGCCEPVDAVWCYLERVPNLARVSISPWANEVFMGAVCRRHGLVYSRKPSPNYVSLERFEEAALYDHFLKTADAARGCSLEIIQRDIYVTNNEPERFVRWVELAREACREAWEA